MQDLALLSAIDAALAIREGRTTARALVEACLARIQAWQPKVNAFLTLEIDAVRADADAADAALKAGRVFGPLHGLPLAHKDMFYRLGKAATCGSKAVADRVGETTASVLSKLKDAGAHQLGTLNMSEFAFNPTGHNPHYGHARNPWSTAHVTGGSSSGSGAAVAARLCFGALGSDTGGSIRFPAAFCGIVGMKTTLGLVSRHGCLPLSSSLDTIGPMARTVADVAAFLSVLAGEDSLDPTTGKRDAVNYMAAIGGGARGLKVGMPTGYFARDVAAPVQQAVDAARKALERQGATIVEVREPDMADANAFGMLLTMAEAASVHRTLLREKGDLYAPQTRTRIEAGYAVPAVQYVDALRARPGIVDDFAEAVFAKADLLLAPVIPMPVPTIAETDVGGTPNMAPLLANLTRLTRPVNYLGVPALTLPAGFDANGVPIGIQLIGRPFDEATLLRAGHAYEQATPWTGMAPTLG